MGATRAVLISDSAPDDSLAQLPAEEQAELQALGQLPDDALRAIAVEQMATATKERMAQLMEKNSLGKLSPTEHHELTILVERGDQLMLRKAEALRLLHERGITVRASNTTSAAVLGALADNRGRAELVSG